MLFSLYKILNACPIQATPDKFVRLSKNFLVPIILVHAYMGNKAV